MPDESLPVVPKSSDQPGMQPTPAELVPAELALNAGDGILYGRMADGTVLPVRARPLGGYGGGVPGTFDGGCCPPVVTEAGDVIPGVVSQPDEGVFRISSIACNPSGATCKWGVTFFHPAGQWGAYHLRGEVRDPATGATKWAFIAVGLWLQRDAGQWHTLDISTAAPWQADGVVVWSPGSPSVGWQPTGRYVMAVGNQVNNDTGPRVVTPVYVFAGPGTVPSCACDPPFPPDFGAYFVVDNGPTTRYDCVGGACVQKSGRAYSVRFGTTMVWPPDGVTSFATEAEAMARAAALTAQDGQYATLSACEQACVSGAWVLTLVPVTYYTCSPACSTPLTWNTYTGPVFTPGATVNPAQFRYATQQEALFVKQAADVVPGFTSQAQCESACTVYWKCDPTELLPHRCTQVEPASVGSALASGTSVHKSADQCAAVCGYAPQWTRQLDFCTNVNTSQHATFLSQLHDLARSYIDRGYSAAVTAVSEPGVCPAYPPGNGSVSVKLRCDGTEDFNDLGDPVSLLQYAVNQASWSGPFPARATRCNPNPAP